MPPPLETTAARTSDTEPREIEELRGIISRVNVTHETCPALAGVHVENVGVTHVGPGWRVVRRTTDYALVLVSVSGQGEVWAEGRWKPISPEEAYVMPTHSLHGYQTATGADEWKYAWAWIDRSDRYPALFASSTPTIIPAPSYSLLAANTGLANEIAHGGDAQKLGLWCELLRASLTSLAKPSSIDPRLGKLWAAVDNRLGESWDIERMATVACLSREHLRRLCVRQLGCSPHRRLKELRMRRTCDLLRSTEATLADIAASVGFSDPFSLSQAFKKEMGMPPSNYRISTRRK